MAQIIRTKWHKIMPLIEADRVYLTAPDKGLAEHWDDYNPNKRLATAFIKALGELPKFVIEDDLLKLSAKENFQQSILDMKKAGVLRLPYPAMTIEFDSKIGSRVIVMLRDNQSPEVFPWEPPKASNVLLQSDPLRTIGPFYGYVIRIESDEDGEYLCISPSIDTIDVRDQNGQAWLQLWGTPHELLEYTPKLSDLVEKTYIKDTTWLWYALSAAMLLMHTAGVAKEVIECEKINRKRLNSKKPIIPRHTYLHIGRVYRSASGDVSDEYIPRKSPIPHWRRGHIKTVHYGKGRANLREVYVHPKLVAYKEYGDEPPMKKEYHVGI